MVRSLVSSELCDGIAVNEGNRILGAKETQLVLSKVSAEVGRAVECGGQAGSSLRSREREPLRSALRSGRFAVRHATVFRSEGGETEVNEFVVKEVYVRGTV